jgi:hypothetical protein
VTKCVAVTSVFAARSADQRQMRTPCLKQNGADPGQSVTTGILEKMSCPVCSATHIAHPIVDGVCYFAAGPTTTPRFATTPSTADRKLPFGFITLDFLLMKRTAAMRTCCCRSSSKRPMAVLADVLTLGGAPDDCFTRIPAAEPLMPRRAY